MAVARRGQDKKLTHCHAAPSSVVGRKTFNFELSAILKYLSRISPGPASLLPPYSTWLRPPDHGYPRWSVPEPEGPLLAAGSSTPLPARHGLCCGRNGDPQRRLQRLTRPVLHGGVVLLLRHVGRGVLPGRNSSLQLPSCFLGKPHGHMCRLRHTHVSHTLGCMILGRFSGKAIRTNT